MEYAYKDLMAKHKLQFNDLSEDAQIGIKDLERIDRMVKLAESKGTSVRSDVVKKIKANDKWICMEILDIVQDTDKNTDEAPFEANEIQQEIKEEQLDPLGLEIEAELQELFNSGKNTFSLDEIRETAKKAYKAIFDNYEEDADNGVQTSKYKLIETDIELFTLTKI